MVTGNQVLAIAQKHIGEKYVLGSLAPIGNPNFKGPWDCAEFVTWCVYQVSGLVVGSKDGDAYTGFWADDIKTKCTKITVEKAAKITGAILLRRPVSSGANKRMGHIAISDGNGRTVEAMDKNHGVTAGKISGRVWDTGLLIKGIDYGAANNLNIAISAPVHNFFFTTPPMQDNLVLQAKRALKDFGINPGTIDKFYDANMQAAIYNYQAVKGLVTDGIMGKQTLKSLKLI
jgi:N-acetylmuramoyl-L-alanine amidase